jgi:hypothetical protein
MRIRPPVIIAGGLLGLMFFLAGGAALHESVTIDEVAHIGAGLSYVQKLDLRYNNEHPPLAKILAGIPLALRGTRADYSSPQWTVGTSFFPAYLGQWVFGDWVVGRWNKPETVLLWARLPMLLLTIVLGWVIFLLGRRLGGDWGGLIAVAAFATTPAFVAFGPLVLTDVPIALFFLLTLWALGDLWRNPDARNTRRFALALTGAVLSKFSSAFLCIAILIFILTTRRWPLAKQPLDKVDAKLWRKQRWRAVRKGFYIAAALVYAVYFVFSWNQPIDIPGLGGHGLVSVAGRLLMPPWLFLRGLFWVVISAVRPSFLLGHAYPHGIWFYFPVLLVLKSQPWFLALLVLTAVLALVVRRGGSSPVIPPELATHWRALWVTLVVFTAICLVSPMDISIRHFSVPLVLLILMLAPLPRLIEHRTPKVRWAAAAVVGVLVLICVVTVIAIYPYYFPYASPLGMGRPDYWLMSDSNVDWNHALPEVNRFARQHGLTDVPIDNYGFSNAAAFVPGWRLWDCQTPADSDAGHWAFLSADMILDSHNCGWLLRYPMTPIAGGAMYAVQLPAAIPPAGSPGGPPLPADRRNFLNAPVEMRAMFLDISNHPDRIQPVMQEFMAKWQEAYAKQKKGK